MKAFALLALVVTSVVTASAQSASFSPNLSLPSLKLQPGERGRDLLAYKPARVAPGEKAAQVWVGIASLSYEKFSGLDAGDEFGFTPTGYLGYQRNFYPGGRQKNGIGYSLGVGFAALGAAAFYHQGAVSGRGVDFRVGVAADFVYYDDFSYFDNSNFIVLPFVAWGIKI